MVNDTSNLITFHGLTDVGIVRDHNEDAFGFFGAGGGSLGDTGSTTIGADAIAVLSDGVGGHEAGELASAMTVASVGALLGQMALSADPEDVVSLRARIEEAMAGQNRNLRLLSKHQGQGTKNMAATVTAVWLAAGKLTLVHAGDSRLYRWRDGKLAQLSMDDTIAGRAIAEGKISEKEGRSDPNWHVLQRAMGIEEKKFGVTVASWEVRDGDAYLLCSDGLTDGMTNAQLEKGFARLDPSDLPTFGEKLIAAGNQASGKDNITVALLNVGLGWCAASRLPENRPLSKKAIMKNGIGKLGIALFAAVLIGFLCLAYSIWQTRVSTQSALLDVSEQQETLSKSSNNDFQQLRMDLAEMDEMLIKLDQKNAENQQRMNAELVSAQERQAKTFAAEQVNLRREVGSLSTKIEATIEATNQAVSAAREKADSVAGQLDGIWAQMDKQKSVIDELNSSLIRLSESQESAVMVPDSSDTEVSNKGASIVADEPKIPEPIAAPVKVLDE